MRGRSSERPGNLDQWLENKTPEVFLSWFNQPDNSVLVAVNDGRVLAVGSVTDAGSINLNYVSPDARFRGVSRALLGALPSEGTLDARSSAPRLPAAFISVAGILKRGHRSAHTGRWLATRWPRF